MVINKMIINNNKIAINNNNNAVINNNKIAINNAAINSQKVILLKNKKKMNLNQTHFLLKNKNLHFYPKIDRQCLVAIKISINILKKGNRISIKLAKWI